MNALVLSNVQLWEIFCAETLELCLRLIKEGKRVVLVSCTGQLVSCAPNAQHNLDFCKRCNKITSHVEQLMSSRGVICLNLDLNRFEYKLINFFYNINSRSELARLKYRNMPIGLLVSSQVIDNTNDAYFSFGENKDYIHKLIINGISLFEAFSSLIFNYQIDEVYAWNGRRPSDGPALYAAKLCGVKAFNHICGISPGTMSINESTSCQDHEYNAGNAQALWRSSSKFLSQKDMAKDALKFFKEYSNGASSGVSTSEMAKMFYRQKPFLPFRDIIGYEGKPILLVITSSPSEAYFLQSYYDAYGEDPYGTFMSIIDDSSILSKYNVIVRWHPAHDNSGIYEKARIRQCIVDHDCFTHIPSLSPINTYSILPYVSTILSMGSTIGWYASILGIPTIVYGPSGMLAGKSVQCYSDILSTRLALLSDTFAPAPFLDALILGYYLRFNGAPMEYSRARTVTEDFGYDWNVHFEGQEFPVHPKF